MWKVVDLSKRSLYSFQKLCGERMYWAELHIVDFIYQFPVCFLDLKVAFCKVFFKRIMDCLSKQMILNLIAGLHTD